MYHKHHTKGLVLECNADGDDSRRVYLLTESFGLLSAKVQGSRSIRSKLRPAIQKYTSGEYSLVQGKGGWKVVSSRADKNFFELLKKSYPKLKVMSSVLSLVKKIAGEEENKEPLFIVVSNFLTFLEDAHDESVSLAECLVLLRILHNLGYMRHDPDFSLPIASTHIRKEDLESIAPKRSKMIELINESLKATQILT